jgi:hypothetical protein
MIKFWFHPLTNKVGIHGDLETLGYSTYEIGVDEIDISDENYFIFRWETTQITDSTFITNTKEFLDLIKYINSLGFFIVADHSTEAINEPLLYNISFLDKLTEIGVNLKNKFILAQNDSYIPYLHPIYYGKHKILKTYFPKFLIETPTHIEGKINSKSPTKDFLCLNRRVSIHKFKLLKRLWELGLLDKTNWTWVVSQFGSQTDSLFYKTIEPNIPKQLDGDVYYGSELANMDEHLYNVNSKWFEDSKVNIITETHTYDTLIHITEKLFKAILFEKPFVVYGNLNYLKFLKELGFKTFDSIIDESWDSLSNSDLKLDKIINSAIQLAKVYDSDEVISICKWNKLLLLDKSHTKSIVERYFLKYPNTPLKLL